MNLKTRFIGFFIGFPSLIHDSHIIFRSNHSLFVTNDGRFNEATKNV